jgi:hypothetical protein
MPELNSKYACVGYDAVRVASDLEWLLAILEPDLTIVKILLLELRTDRE